MSGSGAAMGTVRLLVSGGALALAGCDSWFTTFIDQPRLEPWESVADSIPPRSNPATSVPIHGLEVPGYVISYQPAPATIDSFSPLPNPVPPTEASIQNGWKLYAINCAVCHGDTGAGNGSATRFGMVPISLTTPMTIARTDGYLWGIIRNGRGIMPPYNRIEERERWDVVNYLRGLQGRLGVEVPSGPVGQPGQTGDRLPGFTWTAPTRPVPYDERTLANLRAAPRRPSQPPDAVVPPPPGAGDTIPGRERIP